MPYKKNLTINGIDISVTTEGSGKKTIFFVHGSSLSAETWLPQLNNEQLKADYQLIAIDLPGHGESGRLQGAENYSLKNLAEIIGGVVHFFEPDQYILAGQSYGTNILGEIVPPLQNCLGIMLVSPCIINDQYSPDVVIMAESYGHIIIGDNPPDSELKDYIQYGTGDVGVAERYFRSYRHTDPAFRAAIGNVMINHQWTDELANILNWEVPVCVAFGTQDKLVKQDYLDNYPALWNKQVFKIENARHILNEENESAFNGLLLDFASDIFR